MNENTSPGIAFLIAEVDKTTEDNKLFELWAALAEAGGEGAQEYLVNEANKTTNTKKRQALVRFIGRASRRK